MIVIDWTNFPDPPSGVRSIDIVEVRRIYDFELPPLVIYVGVAEDEYGDLLPAVAIVEEGTDSAKLYLFLSEREIEERGVLASLV